MALEDKSLPFAEKREGWGTLKYLGLWRNEENPRAQSRVTVPRSAQKRGTQDPGTHSVAGAPGVVQGFDSAGRDPDANEPLGIILVSIGEPGSIISRVRTENENTASPCSVDDQRQ